MLTNTQFRILDLFTNHITSRFSLREAAKLIGMNVSLAHRNMKPLLERKLLQTDSHNFISLNYRENHSILAYVESMNAYGFLIKKKELRMFMEEVKEKIKEDSFILLIFGSAVNTQKPGDIDILLIVDNPDKVEFNNRFIHNIASNYSIPIEARTISSESVYEMLAKRDEANVINETLNKHIIFYGAELFYRLIRRGRQ